MNFSLPYSRSRRYLSGIDWTMGTLYSMSRHLTGVGNLSQVILELDGHLDERRLRAVLSELCRKLPVLHGRVARDLLNLCPFWKMPGDSAVREIAVEVAEVQDDEQADKLLAGHVNTPLSNEREHMRLLLVKVSASRSFLGLVFDHRLLDAFGGEAFLQLMEETWQGRLDEVIGQIELLEPAHLDDWPGRFRAGTAVNRCRLRLLEKTVAAFAMPARGKHATGFVHAQLGLEAVNAFTERACDETQVPLLLPSAAARAVAAFIPALASSELQGEQCLVAVSVDARSASERWRQLFFNHLTFMAFSAPMRSQRPDELAVAFRDQWFEQMEEGIPAALESATMLTRICPHAIGRHIARSSFGGRGCSFYFACLRDSAFTSETFLGVPAVNLRHEPRVPTPPAVGLCLTFFHGRMNVVLSHLESVLDTSAAKQTMDRFMALLR